MDRGNDRDEFCVERIPIGRVDIAACEIVGKGKGCDGCYVLGGIERGKPTRTLVRFHGFMYDDDGRLHMERQERNIPAMHGRVGHSLDALTSEGMVHLYVYAGESFHTRILLSDIWRYSPHSFEWKALVPSTSGHSPICRAYHASTVIGQHLYVIGGIQSGGLLSADVWRYHVGTGTWDVLSQNETPRHIPRGRWGHLCFTSEKDEENYIWMLGGVTSTKASTESVNNELWKFNCSSGSWVKMHSAGDAPPPLYNAKSVKIDGGVFVCGGRLPNGEPNPRAYLLDLHSTVWIYLGKLGCCVDALHLSTVPTNPPTICVFAEDHTDVMSATVTREQRGLRIVAEGDSVEEWEVATTAMTTLVAERSLEVAAESDQEEATVNSLKVQLERETQRCLSLESKLKDLQSGTIEAVSVLKRTQSEIQSELDSALEIVRDKAPEIMAKDMKSAVESLLDFRSKKLVLSDFPDYTELVLSQNERLHSALEVWTSHMEGVQSHLKDMNCSTIVQKKFTAFKESLIGTVRGMVSHVMTGDVSLDCSVMSELLKNTFDGVFTEHEGRKLQIEQTIQSIKSENDRARERLLTEIELSKSERLATVEARKQLGPQDEPKHTTPVVTVERALSSKLVPEPVINPDVNVVITEADNPGIERLETRATETPDIAVPAKTEKSPKKLTPVRKPDPKQIDDSVDVKPKAKTEETSSRKTPRIDEAAKKLKIEEVSSKKIKKPAVGLVPVPLSPTPSSPTSEKPKKRKSVSSKAPESPISPKSPKPKTPSSVREPKIASNVREPKTPSSVREPKAASNVREPKTASNVREPKIASNVREPKLTSTVREPKAASNVREPKKTVKSKIPISPYEDPYQDPTPITRARADAVEANQRVTRTVDKAQKRIADAVRTKQVAEAKARRDVEHPKQDSDRPKTRTGDGAKPRRGHTETRDAIRTRIDDTPTGKAKRRDSVEGLPKETTRRRATETRLPKSKDLRTPSKTERVDVGRSKERDGEGRGKELAKTPRAATLGKERKTKKVEEGAPKRKANPGIPSVGYGGAEEDLLEIEREISRLASGQFGNELYR